MVRLLAAGGDRIFSMNRARELSSRVGIKYSCLTEALFHLRQNGWIVAKRRGLHAISSSLPGVNPVHEFEVALALVDPAAISHWSALHSSLVLRSWSPSFIMLRVGRPGAGVDLASGTQRKDQESIHEKQAGI